MVVESPTLDAVVVNALLDIVLKTSGMPHLRAIREVAGTELVQIDADLETQLRPPPEEPAPVEEEAA